jgi:hypothetical protein
LLKQLLNGKHLRSQRRQYANIIIHDPLVLHIDG